MTYALSPSSTLLNNGQLLAYPLPPLVSTGQHLPHPHHPLSAFDLPPPPLVSNGQQLPPPTPPLRRLTKSVNGALRIHTLKEVESSQLFHQKFLPPCLPFFLKKKGDVDISSTLAVARAEVADLRGVIWLVLCAASSVTIHFSHPPLY